MIKLHNFNLICDHSESFMMSIFFKCSKIPLQIVVQIFHMTGYGFLEFQEMFQKYHPIVLRTLLLIVWRKGEISDISRLEVICFMWMHHVDLLNIRLYPTRQRKQDCI